MNQKYSLVFRVYLSLKFTNRGQRYEREIERLRESPLVLVGDEKARDYDDHHQGQDHDCQWHQEATSLQLQPILKIQDGLLGKQRKLTHGV